MLFWKINKDADLKNPKTIEIDAHFIVVQDFGSSAYTEFDYEHDEIIDIYKKNEELMDYRCGLIHSHHTMSAFFSGTDTSELNEKAMNGLYLSLIVNNHMRPVAKLAWKGSVKQTRQATWTWGSFQSKGQKLEDEEKDVIYEVEMDIQWPDEMKVMEEQWDDVEAKEIASRPKHDFRNSKQGDLFDNNGYYNWNDRQEDHTYMGGGFGKKSRTKEDKDDMLPVKRLSQTRSVMNDRDQEPMTLPDQLEMVGILNNAFVAVISGDAEFKGNIHAAFTVFIKDAQAMTEQVIKEDPELGKGDFNTIYNNAIETLAEDRIEKGDDIVCEIASTMSIAVDEYEDFLDSLRYEISDFNGITADAIIEAIRTYDHY